MASEFEEHLRTLRETARNVEELASMQAQEAASLRWQSELSERKKASEDLDRIASGALNVLGNAVWGEGNFRFSKPGQRNSAWDHLIYYSGYHTSWEVASTGRTHSGEESSYKTENFRLELSKRMRLPLPNQNWIRGPNISEARCLIMHTAKIGFGGKQVPKTLLDLKSDFPNMVYWRFPDDSFLFERVTKAYTKLVIFEPFDESTLMRGMDVAAVAGPITTINLISHRPPAGRSESEGNRFG